MRCTVHCSMMMNIHRVWCMCSVSTICGQKKGWAQVAAQYVLSLVIGWVLRAWSPMSTVKQPKPKLGSFWSGKELQRAVQSAWVRGTKARSGASQSLATVSPLSEQPYSASAPYIVWATLLSCWHPAAAPTSPMAEGLEKDLRCLCTV